MSSKGGSAVVAERVAPPLELLESKLHPPQVHGGTVPRTALLDLLRDSADVPIVIVSAPPGYGKTTLLAQWASRSRRPFAWVSLDEHDNDPIVLLSYIATALDRVSPLDPGVFEAMTTPGASVEGTVVPRLVSTAAAFDQSFVLVLDDVGALTNLQCRDAIDALVDHIPSGSRLVLCGRDEPSRRVGVLRARGLALEIGPDDLRMEKADAGELLRAAEVELPEGELGMLVERTEGWPAGIYLAGLSIRASGDHSSAKAIRGDDRYIADYLRSELFPGLRRDELRFLSRTAVLKRMSGPLCDAVLESKGSAEALESLERSNVFVVPLDHNREWYRYHDLFRELLRAELERAQPDLASELLARASDWCDTHGEHETAVAYALVAEDTERVSVLVAANAQRTYNSGRAVTVAGWFDWLEERGAFELAPAVGAIGAWLSVILGHSEEAERRFNAVERGAQEAPASDREQAIEPWLAMFRAARCQRGAERMRADAGAAVGGLSRESPWWPTATLLLAVSHRLGGDEESADVLFADAAETSLATGDSNSASIALAERASIAMQREDWAEAEALAEEAASVVHRSGMEEYAPNTIVHAVAARVAAHRREVDMAKELLARGQRLRPDVTHVLAAFAIQTRLELARAYVALADAAGARTVMREVADLLRRGPDFGTLASQADEVRVQLESVRVDVPGASALTAAELRLLPFLPTHLSFREIGERLYVSRHTVKSQAMSAYRKLDVTSRSAAVERARELGLL